jgi:hypothetical protein
MKVIGDILGWLVVGAIVAAVATFCVMMGVAELHEWWNVIPSMSFWQAFGPTVWFSVPLALYTANNSRNSD